MAAQAGASGAGLSQCCTENAPKADSYLIVLDETITPGSPTEYRYLLWSTLCETIQKAILSDDFQFEYPKTKTGLVEVCRSTVTVTVLGKKKSAQIIGVKHV